LIASLVAAVDSRQDELVAWRRDLHTHPELSWRETRTTSFVSSRLAAAGIRVRPLPGTGLIAEVGAQEPAHRVALRADLDGLPVPERTGLAWASQTQDVCHACGHDVHTVAVLGAGLALQEHAEALREKGIGVRLIFQPAEEVIPGGAHTVLEQGGLSGVDRALAVHCDPTIDVGQVGLVEGPVTAAADSVTVTLSGKGGHTSRPHLTQDLTYALAKVVTDVPAALSRRLDPRAGAALVWGTIHAGGASNVIPASGQATGTLRMLDAEAWASTGTLIEDLVHEVVAPYGVSAQVEHVRGVPPVVNDDAVVATLRAAAAAALDPGAAVPTRQSLGGEDFGWYLTGASGASGALVRLGTRTPGGPTYELHQGDLVVADRAVLVAARLLAAACAVGGPTGTRK
jgi:amidohydrolase